jgi:DnaJ-domain-containing protein 1
VPEPATEIPLGPQAAARIGSCEPPGVADVGAGDRPLGTPRRDSTAALARASARLGIEPGADADSIDEAYRRIIARYDPTRVLPLGPEFAALAVRRLADATAAYETLRSHAHARGE